MKFVKMILPMAIVAAPMAAQGFEGTISMKIPAADGAIGDLKYLVKGKQFAAISTLGAGGGPMAGAEIRMLFDMDAGKMTMLIPLSGDMATQFGAMGGGNMKGIKQVVDMNQAAGQQTTGTAEFKALGTSETIAGHKCDDFQISDNKTVTNVCLANDLGSFAFASGGMGGRRGGGGASPQWASLLNKHPGFPLKVWGADGKVMLEATKIEKGPVSASMFEIPEGFMDMGGMFGGRRGGGR